MRREYTRGDVIGARCRAKHAMDPETTRRLLAAWRTRVSDLLALLDYGAFFFFSFLGILFPRQSASLVWAGLCGVGYKRRRHQEPARSWQGTSWWHWPLRMRDEGASPCQIGDSRLPVLDPRYPLHV